MKYFLLSLSAIIILAACQKTPKPAATRENTLRSSKWKMSSGTIRAKLPSGKDTSLNLLSMLATCNQDDYLSFDSLYIGAVFTGSNKCSPSDPDSIAFTWQMLNNENTINFNNALNLFYRAIPAINPPRLDTVSANPLAFDTLSQSPLVLDTLYPVTYTLVPFDTTTISATITDFSTSSFTIQYSVLSSYLDTTVSHAYLPVVRPDTVNYTVTYNSL